MSCPSLLHSSFLIKQNNFHPLYLFYYRPHPLSLNRYCQPHPRLLNRHCHFLCGAKHPASRKSRNLSNLIDSLTAPNPRRACNHASSTRFYPPLLTSGVTCRSHSWSCRFPTHHRSILDLHPNNHLDSCKGGTGSAAPTGIVVGQGIALPGKTRFQRRARTRTCTAAPTGIIVGPGMALPPLRSHKALAALGVMVMADAAIFPRGRAGGALLPGTESFRIGASF